MIEVPIEMPLQALRHEPTVLLSVNLDRAERTRLDALAKTLGATSRAAVIRQAARVVVEAADAGGVLAGHLPRRGAARTGEGVHFTPEERDALDAAAEKLGVRRGAALRWGVLRLLDAAATESRNGSH